MKNRRVENLRVSPEDKKLCPKQKGVLSVALLVCSFLVFLPATFALFSDSASTEMVFSSVRAADILSVRPVKDSGAVTPSETDNERESYGVPLVENGEIVSLNFGEVSLKSGKNFPKILELTNKHSKPISLSWRFSPELEQIFNPSSGSQTLAAGEKLRWGTKVLGDLNLSGLFEGSVTFSVFNGYVKAEYPVCINLVDNSLTVPGDVYGSLDRKINPVTRFEADDLPEDVYQPKTGSKGHSGGGNATEQTRHPNTHEKEESLQPGRQSHLGKKHLPANSAADGSVPEADEGGEAGEIVTSEAY